MKPCPYCVGTFSTSGYVHELTCPRHPQNMFTFSISNCNDYAAILARVESLEKKVAVLEADAVNISERYQAFEVLSTCDNHRIGVCLAPDLEQVIKTNPGAKFVPITYEKYLRIMSNTEQKPMATCKDCGEPIEYTGQYWRHTGKQYKHVAKPHPQFDITS